MSTVNREELRELQAWLKEWFVTDGFSENDDLITDCLPRLATELLETYMIGPFLGRD